MSHSELALMKEIHRHIVHFLFSELNIKTWLVILRIFASSFQHIYDHICQAVPIQNLLLVRCHNSNRFAVRDRQKRILDMWKDTFQSSYFGSQNSILSRHDYWHYPRYNFHQILKNIGRFEKLKKYRKSIIYA